MTEAPFFSCVVPIFREKNNVSYSIESILSQTYEDFELIIVDDGADEETRQKALSYADPRIVYLRRANDGAGSARNWGISHAKGRYLSFLDGDDSRPNWAFQTVRNAIDRSEPDVIFANAVINDKRMKLRPFHDNDIFSKLSAMFHSQEEEPDRTTLDRALPLLMLLEPTPAGKFIKTSFWKQSKISFPSVSCFEDVPLVIALISNMETFSIVNDPLFTYHLRYGHGQMTDVVDTKRFDALMVSRVALQVFAKNPLFNRTDMRISALVSVTRIIQWCFLTISHYHRNQYLAAIRSFFSCIDKRYIQALHLYNAYKFPEELTSLWAKEIEFAQRHCPRLWA